MCQIQIPTLSICFTTLLLMTACEAKVGGACQYINGAEQATVSHVDKSYVMLSNEHNQFETAHNLFSSPPIKGQKYTVHYQHISKGSCTPMLIESVRLETMP
ncbi:hypothetical protein [Marinomonas sp. TW1]|uniref:hypothetical protein n=1 Tax=Marinomonas sp. TW1 TaxID=1561203 RepID=UPI0007AFE059|nr:hypothetical protein [Marinomonas sp. TW1]KZN15240.1 hypothetical protein OA79_00135 [Marinomonas sp. TW1]